MSLLDTIDGAFMNFAYGWAFSKPVRKVFYNITITWLSVVVALVIGTIELMSVLADKLSLDRPALGLRLRPRPQLRRLRDRRVFVLTWVVALAIWHVGRIEERWSAGMRRQGRHEGRRGPRHNRRRDDLIARASPLRFEEIEEVLAVLREQGHRVSTACRLVLEALFAADGPVSAQFIADGLGGRAVSLELTSVYRNLERLEELGVVQHVHLGHGPGLYMLVGSGDKEFLACERCGRVTSVDPAELDPVRTQIRKRFGYRAHFGHFAIIGLCAGCAADADAGEPSKRRDHGHEHEHSHGDHVHSHPHRHGRGGQHSHRH